MKSGHCRLATLDEAAKISFATMVYRDFRSKLIRELRSIGGVEVFDSKANFVTFKPEMDADRVYRGLLERGIVVKNLGSLPVIGHCLRVTVGLPEMNKAFLKGLREVLAC